MKCNFYYVLFFCFLLSINEYSVLCLRKNVNGPSKISGGSNQRYTQENSLNEDKDASEEKKLEEFKGKKISQSPQVNSVAKPVQKLEKTDKKTLENEASSVEFTLPEIEIDPSQKIEHYYPYFYKTHIIEYHDTIDYQELTNDCKDLGCQWCDNTTRMTCSECRHGFFLYNEKCYGSCPENYVADIFKKKCIPLNDNSKN